MISGTRRRGPRRAPLLARAAVLGCLLAALLVPVGLAAPASAVMTAPDGTVGDALDREPLATDPELTAPSGARRLGLPVAVAVVALFGAASLVVRVLLAEPVDRRARPVGGPSYGPLRKRRDW